MGRAPCCDKANVKRGPWSPEEDAALKRYVETHGTGGNWIALPQKAGLKRCGKSCRLRWLNYLRPDIKHGGFTEEEDNIICALYSQMGSRWSLIASQLPGRTDNDVKNHWNTKLKKKLLAGKTSLNSSTDTTDYVPTDTNPLQLGSTPSLQPCLLPKPEAYSLDFSASQSQISATLPMLAATGYGLSVVSSSQNLSALNPINILYSSSSEVTPVSQDGSSLSVSDSTSNSLAVAVNNSGDVSHHEDAGISLADHLGFEFPYDFVNGLWSTDHQDHKSSEHQVAPSFYGNPNVADFSHADIKPHGLDQRVANANQY